jgi:hypothetical protein
MVERAFSLAIFAVAQIPIGVSAANCLAGSPEVATVAIQRVDRLPNLNLYHVRVTVTNRGNETQAGNTLQFVDVTQYGDRLDDKGVPPLGPGESYSWTYVWKRSADAGKGTTPLNFRYRLYQPYQSSQLSNACVANTAQGINF